MSSPHEVEGIQDIDGIQKLMRYMIRRGAGRVYGAAYGKATERNVTLVLREFLEMLMSNLASLELVGEEWTMDHKAQLHRALQDLRDAVPEPK